MPSAICGKPCGPIGVGLMSLTHPGKHPSLQDAIATLKAALEAGGTFWDGGWFYGTPEYNSCHLLHAYFTRYPEDAPRVTISIKACFDMATATAHVDAQGVRENIEKCLKVLDGTCKVDVFQPARLDPDIPVEETVAAISQFVKEGKVGGVGLSECSAESIRRACKVYPIVAAEIELSLFSTDSLKNGILDACVENDVALVAYSPLGKGLLSGALRKVEDIPDGDYRRTFFPRFGKEAFDENLKLVDEIGKIAEKKGVTLAQVAIAWVAGLSKSEKAPVIPIPSVSSLKRVEENLKVVHLTVGERKELDEILERIEVKGSRAPGRFAKFLEV